MITAPVICTVDASVGIKLVITEALSNEAHSLFAHLANDPAARFFAPDLFDIECANILWKQVQRVGYPVADAHLNLAAIGELAIQRINVTSVALDALKIATDFHISAYDASNVAVAVRVGAPLITADTRLAAKFAGSPYSVLDLGQLVIPAIGP